MYCTSPVSTWALLYCNNLFYSFYIKIETSSEYVGANVLVVVLTYNFFFSPHILLNTSSGSITVKHVACKYSPTADQIKQKSNSV